MVVMKYQLVKHRNCNIGKKQNVNIVIAYFYVISSDCDHGIFYLQYSAIVDVLGNAVMK